MSTGFVTFGWLHAAAGGPKDNALSLPEPITSPLVTLADVCIIFDERLEMAIDATSICRGTDFCEERGETRRS